MSKELTNRQIALRMKKTVPNSIELLSHCACKLIYDGFTAVVILWDTGGCPCYIYQINDYKFQDNKPRTHYLSDETIVMIGTKWESEGYGTFVNSEAESRKRDRAEKQSRTDNADKIALAEFLGM